MLRSPLAVVALLTLLNLVNYIDRYVISAVGTSIQRDLGFSDAVFGVLGSVSLWGFALSGPVFGRLATRYPRRLLLCLGILAWSVATLAFGVFGSLFVLLAARVVLGVGMADFTAISPTFVDDVASEKRKGKLLAIFFAAIPVGSALGFVVGGAMDASFGWRMAFIAMGALGIALAPSALALPEKKASVRKSPSFLAGLRTLFAIKTYRWTVLGYAAQTFALGGFAYWTPTFLQRQYGLSVVSASTVFGGVVVATGCVGTLLGGWILDRMHGPDRVANALKLSLVATACAVPMAFLAVTAPTAAMFISTIAVGQVLIFATLSPINMVFLQSVPGAMRASAMGGSMFLGRFLGDAISIWLVGAVSGASQSLVAGMLVLPTALLVNIVFWMVARRTKA